MALCHKLSRKVVSIVQQHVHPGSAFLEYDSTLAREGIFAAGFFLAAENGLEEEVGSCVKALKLMRWAFSNAEERVKTIQMAWEARRTRTRQSSPSTSSISSGESFAEQRPRPVPSPLSIPAPFSATIPGLEPSTPLNDGHQLTPPDSASSSAHSFLSLHDYQDPYSARSSPASSQRPSLDSSPASGSVNAFVAPGRLHSTYTQQDDDAHMSSNATTRFYDDLATFLPPAHTAHHSHTLSQMPSHASLRTGMGPSVIPQHDVGTGYASAMLFDSRPYAFPAEAPPMGVHHSHLDVLGAPFDIAF